MLQVDTSKHAYNGAQTWSIPSRKAVQNHEGRTEIQNELVEKRRARTHGFRAEMVVRTVGSEWKIHVGNGISV